MSSTALTATQKKQIKEFSSVTGANEKTAADWLKRFKYSLDAAVDNFFSSGASAASAASVAAAAPKVGDVAKLNALFDTYADPDDKDIMAGEGMIQFFNDVHIDDPEGGADTLAVAWKLECTKLGLIQRNEFVNKLSSLGLDSINVIAKYFDEVRASLNTPATFKEFYKWVFNYLKDGPTKRTVAKEVVLPLWQLLIPASKYPLIVPFSEYMEEAKEQFVSRDVWVQVLDFVQQHKPDLSNFDDSGAWPLLCDEFVTWAKKNNKV